MRQETAALREFNPGYDRSGSFTTGLAGPLVRFASILTVNSGLWDLSRMGRTGRFPPRTAQRMTGGLEGTYGLQGPRREWDQPNTDEQDQLSPGRHIRLATHGRPIQMCHVWTAPSWQGESSRRVAGRCSHVFGLLVRFT